MTGSAGTRWTLRWFELPRVICYAFLFASFSFGTRFLRDSWLKSTWADSPTHGKTRVQINSQNRGTDQEILEKPGYRSISFRARWQKKEVLFSPKIGVKKMR